MNTRITKLRKQSTGTKPSISAERAQLVTEFYNQKDSEKLSIPVKRAKTFQYILEHKKLCINDGELIVGERGPGPQATPTYPEICLHSVQDLDILNNREKISFSSSEETKQIYTRDIIPFWEGKTIRDIMFRELPGSWQDAYKAGVFTEFMEQRPPGHTVLDNKIYKKGMVDFIKEIDEELMQIKLAGDKESYEKEEQLKAMKISAEAIIIFANRYAKALLELSKNEKEKKRKEELLHMSAIF